MPRPRRVVAPDSVALGTSGLRRLAGRIMEGSLRELTGSQGMRNLREFSELDVIAGPALRLQELFLRDIKWDVKPADPERLGEDPATGETRIDPAAAEQDARFVDSCLRDMDAPLNEVVSEAWTMSTYGWSLLEVVHKVRGGEDAAPPSNYDDGAVGWAGMYPRAQETLHDWHFEDGQVIGMRQMDPWSGERRGIVEIPLGKALHCRTRNARGNPEGWSPLTPAWQSYKFGKRYQEIEAILAARFSGVPVLKMPDEALSPTTTAGTAAKAAAQKILLGLQVDDGSGVMLSSKPYAVASGLSDVPMWDLSFVTPQHSNAPALRAVIVGLEQRRAAALMIGFMLLGQDRLGTQALAETLAESIFLRATNALAGMISDAFSRQVIPRLMRYNGRKASEAPSLVAEPLKRLPNLKEFADYVRALQDLGVPLLPDPATEAALRARGDLPSGVLISEEQ